MNLLGSTSMTLQRTGFFVQVYGATTAMMPDPTRTAQNLQRAAASIRYNSKRWTRVLLSRWRFAFSKKNKEKVDTNINTLVMWRYYEQSRIKG